MSFSLVTYYRERAWFWNYLKFKLGRLLLPPKVDPPLHVIFLFVDHFEPKEGVEDPEKQWARVKAWLEGYPPFAQRHRDAHGVPPQHTWFYHVESWEGRDLDARYLSALSELCYQGLGEIEMHLHHGPPAPHPHSEVITSHQLEELITRLKDFFALFGALITAESVPRQVFGFIHGKWALDNSHDGLYCGVNNELSLLARAGCYADFTMPSGVSITQSKKINSIYYAKGDPKRPKGFDKGNDVRVRGQPEGDLLIFQGPLELSWGEKRFGFSVEDASVEAFRPFSEKRLQKWVRCQIGVRGRPNWVFVKIHTHGAREHNFPLCFGEPAEQFYTYLEDHFNDGLRFKLHYVTAREAYNIVKAAEAGEDGDPGEYRNFLIPPYANKKIRSCVPYRLRHFGEQSCELTVLDLPSKVHFEFKDLFLKEITGQGPPSQGDFSFGYSYRPDSDKVIFSLRFQGSVQVKCLFPLSKGKPVLQDEQSRLIEQGKIGQNVAYELQCSPVRGQPICINFQRREEG